MSIRCIRRMFLDASSLDLSRSSIRSADADIPKTVGTWLRSIRRPSINDMAVAKLLAQLDKIGSNVNQLAHYSKAGPAYRPHERQHRACATRPT